jgi:phenylalanyl-tRNA synthetase beta chain
VAGVMRRLGIARRELVVETMSNDLLDPALVYKNRGGKLLGVLGVVDEAVASKFDVDQPVYFAQFNWNLLCKLSSKKEVKYTDLPKTLPLAPRPGPAGRQERDLRPNRARGGAERA